MLITVLPLTRWHQAVSSMAKVEKIEMSGRRLTNPGSAASARILRDAPSLRTTVRRSLRVEPSRRRRP